MSNQEKNVVTTQAMADTATEVKSQSGSSLMAKFAHRYGVDAKKMNHTLKRTAFKTRDREPDVTDEQMMALVVVADQYRLNPFTREIYAFPQNGGIVPIVSVDGWSRIINSHPQFNGVEFRLSDESTEHQGKHVPVWCECVIHRKGKNEIMRKHIDDANFESAAMHGTLCKLGIITACNRVNAADFQRDAEKNIRAMAETHIKCPENVENMKSVLDKIGSELYDNAAS